MITRVLGAALCGIEPYVVTVETALARGLPKFDIVGLARGAVQEGKNRIVTALQSSGVAWGPKRVTVNLAPAAVMKDGSALDLPIALGLLSALGVIPAEALGERIALGELALDGALRPVRGALVFAELAKGRSDSGLILPYESSAEAELVPGLQVWAPRSLAELIGSLQEGSPLPPQKKCPTKATCADGGVDWADVAGQALAKRALEIAAAGGHHILLAGPPGVGKTLLARRMPTILPPLTGRELGQVRRICSASGLEFPENDTPPFRAPHHLASLAGMMGGGRPFSAGEVTLAHGGVLFLDEFAEFRRDVVEGLREPLETEEVRLVRAGTRLSLPASFLFVAAMNLCPCGALGDDRKSCFCTPPTLERYRNKVSGPIRDRLDLWVELARPSFNEFWEPRTGERSVKVRKRVVRARAFQRSRQGDWVNGKLSAVAVRSFATPHSEGVKILAEASERMALSARALDKILRVARTIADLEESPEVSAPHVAEALQYRMSGVPGL